MKVLRSIQRVPKGVKISLKINPMNKIINKLGVNKLALLLSLFCFFIYFITSPGNTSYNYFTRLADAFLNQRYYLTEGPPWLNELIPIGNDRFFVAYAPMPAIVAIPFVAFFGKNFPQQIIAHLLGAGIVFYTVLTSYKIKKDKTLALWSGLLVGLGSIVWYLSSVGSSWYYGQITAAFFLTGAIYSTLKGKKALVTGVLLGAAYLARPHTLLSLPFFLYIYRKNLKTKILTLAIGILPFFLFNSFYNFIRFGVPWDKGYILIPGMLEEVWYQKGLFHPSYIPSHLKVIFASFPVFKNTYPYVFPSLGGLAIWITTPAFIYSLKANIKENVVKFAWLALFLIALVVVSHGATGFTQFGYRFAVDFYPLLIFLTIKGVLGKKLSLNHWLLIIFSIIVNLWGVIFINKFNWWVF